MRLEALVLAAGSGSRFGGGKLLAPWNGGLLIEAALAAAFNAPVGRVTVVWGADRRVGDAALAWARRLGWGDRLRLVEATHHAEGLSASLKAGVAAIDPECDGVFVFLGDMPRIPKDLANLLMENLADGADAVAPVFAGKRGHPVLFAKSRFKDLATAKGDRGAGDLLRRLGDRLALVEAPDDGVLYDVDRPQDLVD